MYFCYRCDLSFETQNETIKHMRRDHFVIDNTTPIKCVVRNCEKSYHTFSSLRNHLRTFQHSSEKHVSIKYSIIPIKSNEKEFFQRIYLIWLGNW